MGLSDKQFLDMYKCTLKNSTDISWIRDTLKTQTANIKECQEHIAVLDSSDATSRGKIGYLAAGIAAIFTVISNGLIWILSSYGSK